MALDNARVKAYRKRNLRAIALLLTLWALVTVGGVLAADSLNNRSILQIPLGYWLAAQGSILLFIAELFGYAKYVESLDRRYGSRT